ncbi:MAG: metallophosphoesterase [Candidatus Bathyarchaeia archaeon]|jgi:putative SbcD/Mre11-related phosphoesterase
MLKLLFPHPAALIKTQKTKTLLISDPHIGWENELQKKGIHVPSQTIKLFDKLANLITQHQPDRLIVLGDVKYTVMKTEPGEWHDIPEFFGKLSNLVKDIAIVRGNHDANLEPLLPENVKMFPATGTVVGDVGVFHGHKWPSPELLKCKTLVMGHLHPVVVFRDPAGFKITRQVWMRANCDTNGLAKVFLEKHGTKREEAVEQTLKEHFGFKAKTSELLIMPSFNDFLGGRPINETHPRKETGSEGLIGPVLRSKAVDVARSELYMLDGTYLGTLNQLKTV